MSRTNKALRLKTLYGERCFWCGLKMRFPNYGVKDFSINDPDMATVEHHYSKLKKKKHFMFLRLVHRRCNL